MHPQDAAYLKEAVCQYDRHEDVTCPHKYRWDSGDYMLWHCRVAEKDAEVFKMYGNHLCHFPYCPSTIKGGHMPSQLEIENAKKVRSMIEQIDGITYDTVREDIFSLTETETGDELQLTVDVEESTVCLIMDIGEIDAFTGEDPGSDAGFFSELLRINDEAVHGKFTINGSQILFRDTLEIENLDQNELEAAIAHMFLIVAQKVPSLLPEPVGA